MVKLLVSLMVIMLLAFIGYHQTSTVPLTARGSIDAGIEQVKKGGANISAEEEQLLRVQLALSDYMATHGTAPDSLAALVPKYFDSEPKDPRTGQPYPYRLEGRSPKLGAQIDRKKKGAANSTVAKSTAKPDDLLAALGPDFINPNTIEIDSFVYDASGKRDPFEQLDLSEPIPEGATPLEAYSIGQLRLTAVLMDVGSKPKAIVEDSHGRGYTVMEGTRIGNQGGIVVAIEKGLLKIVETKKDFTGREVQNAIEMKIQLQNKKEAKK